MKENKPNKNGDVFHDNIVKFITNNINHICKVDSYEHYKEESSKIIEICNKTIENVCKFIMIPSSMTIQNIEYDPNSKSYSINAIDSRPINYIAYKFTVGDSKTTQITQGMTCSICNIHNEYVSSATFGSNYICYNCR